MNSFSKALLLAALAVFASGCTTEGFCFDNCAGNTGGAGNHGDSGTGNGSGGFLFTQEGGTCIGANCPASGDSGTTPTCVPTNGGVEICDGKDNDCDGLIDEPGTPPSGIDFSDPHTCGNCATDCTQILDSVVTPQCTPPTTGLGTTAGTCSYTGCAPNQYDVDGDPSNGCEYYCPWNPGGVNKVDLGGPFGCGKDDDCNGKIDDGLNFCSDPQNCGSCGFVCSLANTASSTCVSTASGADGGAQCNPNNTHCVIGQCAPGFFDANGSPDDGCEYPCTITNGGVEICDGLDNDCNGLIDDEDPGLQQDPEIGQPCTGGNQGVCAANQGVTKCIDAAVKCCDTSSNSVQATSPRYPQTGLRNDVCVGLTGPHVTVPGQLQEICNGLDDNCDGVVDGATIDSGGVCGSSVGTCTTGAFACVGGVLTCVGNTGADPNGEVCDGKDNDCDGVIDGTAPATKIPCTSDADCTTAPNFICLPLSNDPNNKGCVAPPKDIASLTTGAPLPCDVPPPPPAGVSQPCKAGTMACFGGTPVCQGAVTKPQDTDLCGQDTNCNGVLDNQTGLANSDPLNCGACGNVCSAQAPNANWQCQSGTCVTNGCAPGFIECGGANPNDCETACTFQQSTELCDGIDNNCNCKVDEGPITPPSVVQACGVSPLATDPGCLSKVSLSCVNGGWKCTFTDPAYCTTGNCKTTPDICDGKDNNCDGVIDEGFRPPALLTGFLGQACFSDDGKPPPGDGPCRTQGSFVCAANGLSTMCSATKNMSLATAEICDGVDNDCNGIVDDPAEVAAKDPRIGQACFGGTQGICALAANAGKNACVSGAVSCTGANIVHPGDKLETCNGKDDDCDGVIDDNLTDTGGVCGSSVGQCKTGTEQCVSGALKCNDVGPTPEICDGLDNNCNGQIDDSPTDVGTACNVPPPPPTGVPQPCKAGVNACIGGTKVCEGSITAASPTDACGEDTNCDGKLTNQTGLKNNDVFNCGACGNNCNTIDANSIWACTNGACVHAGCKTGFIDCDANPNTCERACSVTSTTEICDGKDNDCNCKVDDNVPAVTPAQVCGVSPAATDPGCTSGVTTTCTGGAWKCTFPAGYCTGTSCATTPELCDGEDNNCNGVVDESFSAPALVTGFLGEACTTPSTDGPCQGTGSYVCAANHTSTVCNATKNTGAAKAETCNGIDDDCDGTVDDNLGGDARVGKQCFGGTQGACAAAGHAGSTVCQGGAVVCTGANLLTPNSQPEICNGIDDDCDGVVDDNPTDVGQSCGSGVGACVPGKVACVAGAPKCQGGTGPKAETCNGIDDDCDGTTDDNLTDTGGTCNVPPAAPAPTTQCPVVAEPCKQGTLACTGGVLVCSGSVTASSSTPDGCCSDSNCDGTLTNQPDFSSDVANCGSCGHDCNALNAGKHGVWACQTGACVRTGCALGFIDCDSNHTDCERACTYSGAELCNGVDDDCDCTVDDNIASVPTPSQVCGVSAAASDPKCQAGDGTTGVKVACTTGAWKCTFPTGYCSGGSPPSCSATTDTCDGEDNNCNGNTDENEKPPVLTTGYLNEACASDDGKPYPGDGQCRGTGVYICNGPTSTKCNATKNLSAATSEVCDGVDNDCDGLVDETYNNKGTNTSFVIPAVVKVSSSPNLWIYQYEASRPNATASTPGSGDGYWTSAPSGSTLDKTAACSVSGNIPWFNVTPTEVTQTCAQMGGTICAESDWTKACQGSAGSCTWGYGTACTSSPATLTAGDGTVYYDTSKTPFCNLGPYDFDRTAGAPNADGLLPTGGGGLLNGCYALYGGGASTSIFDITGNLREITSNVVSGTTVYPVMGGAFNTASDGGATCTFDFYTVSSTFEFFDSGFRCCFSTDPTK